MVRDWLASVRHRVAAGVRSHSRRPSTGFSRVAFVGPNYDDLTDALSNRLTTIEEEIPAEPKMFFGATAEPDSLVGWLSQKSDLSLLVVFFGHGAPEHLLTAPELGSGVDADSDHGVLCSSPDLIGDKARGVIAFCCHAATRLGREFRSATTGNRFLGFLSDVPFPRTRSDIASVTGPMENSVKDVIANRRLALPELRTLIDRYEAEWNRWTTGEFAQHDRAMLISMCLEEHVAALDLEV